MEKIDIVQSKLAYRTCFKVPVQNMNIHGYHGNQGVTLSPPPPLPCPVKVHAVVVTYHMRSVVKSQVLMELRPTLKVYLEFWSKLR